MTEAARSCRSTALAVFALRPQSMVVERGWSGAEGFSQRRVDRRRRERKRFQQNWELRSSNR